jgi:hypothetical protein
VSSAEAFFTNNFRSSSTLIPDFSTISLATLAISSPPFFQIYSGVAFLPVGRLIRNIALVGQAIIQASARAEQPRHRTSLISGTFP